MHANDVRDYYTLPQLAFPVSVRPRVEAGLVGVGSVSGRPGFEPPQTPLERDLVERTEENVTVDLEAGDPWPVPVGCPVD
jgi:hypothetical protein